MFTIYQIVQKENPKLKRPVTKAGQPNSFIVRKTNVRQNKQEDKQSNYDPKIEKRNNSTSLRPVTQNIGSSQNIQSKKVILSEEDQQKFNLVNFMMNIYQTIKVEVNDILAKQKSGRYYQSTMALEKEIE